MGGVGTSCLVGLGSGCGLASRFDGEAPRCTQAAQARERRADKSLAALDDLCGLGLLTLRNCVEKTYVGRGSGVNASRDKTEYGRFAFVVPQLKGDLTACDQLVLNVLADGDNHGVNSFFLHGKQNELQE